MRTVIAAALYSGTIAGATALAGAGAGDWFFIWAAATFILGWTTRSPWLLLLPMPVVSIATPFLYSGLSGEGEPLPIWFVAGYFAALLTLIVLAGWGGRKLYNRLRRPTTAAQSRARQ